MATWFQCDVQGPQPVRCNIHQDHMINTCISQQRMILDKELNYETHISYTLHKYNILLLVYM